MRMPTLIRFLLSAAIVFLALIPNARADNWNKKTYIRFSDSVEVPGAILPPGTYVFKLANLPSNRNVVQIMSEDEDFVYATVIAIRIERLDPADHTLLRFDERPAGQPVALHTWFYPGDTFGNEFVYPDYGYRYGPVPDNSGQ